MGSVPSAQAQPLQGAQAAQGPAADTQRVQHTGLPLQQVQAVPESRRRGALHLQQTSWLQRGRG